MMSSLFFIDLPCSYKHLGVAGLSQHLNRNSDLFVIQIGDETWVLLKLRLQGPK